MIALQNHQQMNVADATTTGFLVEDEGFCIARNVVAPTLISLINEQLDLEFPHTPFCSGKFYGERTKRIGRLPARNKEVTKLIMAPMLLDLAQRILGPWCDTIQLNVAQAIEVHPGALAQFPHRDQDMWPDAAGSHEYLINVIWPLTPFTIDNGATIIWPDSHGSNALLPEIGSQPVTAVADPGDAIIFLGSTLHAAGANRTNRCRRGIVVGYSLGWVRPYENPWLAYPPEVARCFAPDLAGLVGYRQHRPNLGNYEGQCPSILLSDQMPSRPGAIDALRPEQVAALNEYVERQRLESGSEPFVTASVT